MNQPGLTCMMRSIRLAVADTPANRKIAQKLLERFGEEWLDAFPAYCQPTATAEPISQESTT